ncbi:MAG: class I SAM-dependent methyltransferase [Promethearchaeati archaeon]
MSRLALIKWNKFAEDYHNKRRKPWNAFKSFFNETINQGYTFNGLIIDLGCANGRHFSVLKNDNNRIIGIDNSIEFLKIARENLPKREIKDFNINNINLLLADISKLPLRDNSIKHIISVAALHHIMTKKERRETFDYLHKILNYGGFLLISVWRRWQKRFKTHFIKNWIKRKLIASFKKDQINKGLMDFGDIFVPWTISSENNTINRFYHLFSSKELHNLLNEFKIIKFEKRGGPGAEDNFFVLAQKK